ncbi:hypothetical protein XELAEV_18018747mg [Xenopus laevis]|uniref:Uncharacterized protein n=1 Tax=Xenopus laevis TaxID=8355 RepID=A0A974DFJ2_XENLA|nr:hypothetical protein XELAEV_18018747mg [Xenopus laevis]
MASQSKRRKLAARTRATKRLIFGKKKCKGNLQIILLLSIPLAQQISASSRLYLRNCINPPLARVPWINPLSPMSGSLNNVSGCRILFFNLRRFSLWSDSDLPYTS